MNKLLETILDEQKFPYEGMTLDERNYYLSIITNCKDVSDSKYKVDGESKGQIMNLYFRKTNNQIRINGFLKVGSKTCENRCIDGYIFIYNNRILVDTHITRLLSDGCIEYTVLDEFKIINGLLKRRSFYNCDMKSSEIEINDTVMKGNLK